MKLLFSALIWLFLSQPALAKKAKTIFMSDKKMEPILVAPGRSVVLNFPTRPTKVIVGNQGLFGVEYVEDDLAIAALKAPAHSNMFVYLDGRRFGFDLRTTTGDGDEIVLVRDTEDQKIKVKVKNE